MKTIKINDVYNKYLKDFDIKKYELYNKMYNIDYLIEKLSCEDTKLNFILKYIKKSLNVNNVSIEIFYLYVNILNIYKEFKTNNNIKDALLISDNNTLKDFIDMELNVSIKTHKNIGDKIDNYKNIIYIQSESKNILNGNIEIVQTIKHILTYIKYLNKNGSLTIYVNLLVTLPLINKFINFISYLFGNITIESFKNYLIINCINFKSFDILTPKLIKDYDNFLLLNNPKDDLIILDDIKIFNNTNEKGELIIKYCNNYLNFYIIQNHSSKNLSISDDIYSSYILNILKDFIRLIQDNNISNNKFYYGLLTNYNEELYTQYYTIYQPIEQIIYISNKMDDYNKSISNLNNNLKLKLSYKYDEYQNIIDKLISIKISNKIYKNYIKDEKKLKQLILLNEDFTRNIAQYVSKNFGINSVSNGFVKLWEILNTFSVFNFEDKKYVTTFHMCEAPGQWINSTSFYIEKYAPFLKHKWLANSLNAHNKYNIEKFGNNIFDDTYGFISKYRSRWLYGNDDTGDIMKSENIMWFNNYFKNIGYVPDLITGDGGLNMDDNNLYLLQKLDYSQFLLTSSILNAKNTLKTKNKTNCIIKCFTPFIETYPETFDSSGFFINLMYLYKMIFKEVYLYKPITSNSTSGEFYIIGKNNKYVSDEFLNILISFQDNFEINMCFFKKDEIPKKFSVQIYSFIEKIYNLMFKSTDKFLYILSCSLDDSDVEYKNKMFCSEILSTHKNDRYEEWIKRYGLDRNN